MKEWFLLNFASYGFSLSDSKFDDTGFFDVYCDIIHPDGFVTDIKLPEHFYSYSWGVAYDFLVSEFQKEIKHSLMKKYPQVFLKPKLPFSQKLLKFNF